MKFLGLLILDILVLIPVFLNNRSAFTGKKASVVIMTFTIVLAATYLWSIGVMYALMVIIQG